MDDQDVFFGDLSKDLYERIADVKDIATEKMKSSTEEVKDTFTNQFDKMRAGMNET